MHMSMPTMNLNGAAFCDDQMVPQGPVTIGTPQIFKGISFMSQKSLPDFDTLLQDLSETFEMAEYAAANQVETTSHLRLIELDRQLQDEVTFYEDVPLKPFIKEEKLSFSECTQQATQQLVPAEFYSQPSQEDDETKREIEQVCNNLDIPTSPYSWSQSQVNKWVTWVLNSYNFPLVHMSQMQMDGTQLCMLSEEDFQARCPHDQVGQCIYVQLEIWKNAYNIFNCQTPAGLPIKVEETQTFMDLDAVQMTIASTEAMTGMSSMSSIPRPVFSMVNHLSPSVSPAPSVESLDSSSCSSLDGSYNGWGSMQAADMDIKIESTTARAPPRYTPPQTGAGGMIVPSKQNIHLWQFLRELLLHPESYSNCIRWLDRSKGIFKIEDSARVARLWGQRKNRPAMNYDKLSRSIRQYYKKGIIKKTENSKRLVYQFCPQYRI